MPIVYKRFNPVESIAYFEKDGEIRAIPVEVDSEGNPIITDAITAEATRRFGTDITPDITYKKIDNGDTVSLLWSCTKSGQAVRSHGVFTKEHTTYLREGTISLTIDGTAVEYSAPDNWTVPLNKTYTITCLSEGLILECIYDKGVAADEIAHIPFDEFLPWPS